LNIAAALSRILGSITLSSDTPGPLAHTAASSPECRTAFGSRQRSLSKNDSPLEPAALP